MSSNEHRSVNDLLPQFQSIPGEIGIPDKITPGIGRVAASNSGHYTQADLPSGGRCQVAAGLAFSHRSGQPGGQSHLMWPGLSVLSRFARFK
jgi:hypothetical protein